jgi:hypothetical protein
MRADQRVDEGRLAGIELADYNEQEQFIQVELGLAQLTHVFRGRSLARQKLTQTTQDHPFVAKQLAHYFGHHSVFGL